MEENAADTARNQGFKSIYAGFILILAICLGGVHYAYVSTVFENEKHFSFLSDLEREMSLRTEMGFYYSYYKTIVQTKPFMSGIYKLLYDKLVEYPKEVNAFSRFSIHPEVLIGSMYRFFEPWLNNSDHKECYIVGRDEGHAAVETCIGIGVPIFFYLEAVWWLAGVTVATLFIYATVLSDSIFGGLMTVLQYFANHAECTRVQWAPNERENFAMPFILMQSWLQTVQLKRKKTSMPLQVPIFLLNIASLVFWQFTPFIFMVQAAIFFIMEQLCIIDAKSLSLLLYNHIYSVHTAAILFQGADKRMMSVHTVYYLVIAVYSMTSQFTRIEISSRFTFYLECLLVLIRLWLTTWLAFFLKNAFRQDDDWDDAHVWDLLYSKFTNFKSFHTLIYTCSEVFDFLPMRSIVKMSKTLLLPIVLIYSMNAVEFWVNEAFLSSKKEIDDERKRRANRVNENSGIDTEDSNRQVLIDRMDMLVVFVKKLKIEPAVFYNLAQMAVFGLMAVLIMRLKLLFSTQMCIVSSMVVKKYFLTLPKFLSKYLKKRWLYAIMIIPILGELYLNVTKEFYHEGEFSEYQQEELLNWISEEQKLGAFAGSMPVSATVMLNTRQPVVTHPHYENHEARQRAYAVYKMYGKFSPQHFYQEMTRLKATHLIVESKYCYGKSGLGCSFEYIWDIEAPKLKWNSRLCELLLTKPVEHFYQVFRNEQYAVFRIHDVGVRYMPRSFTT